MKQNNNLSIAALVVGGFLLLKYRGWGGQAPSSTKRNQVIQFARQKMATTGEDVQKFTAILMSMTAAEIDAVHEFFFQYIAKGWQVPTGSTLERNIEFIRNKYNIFT